MIAHGAVSGLRFAIPSPWLPPNAAGMRWVRLDSGWWVELPRRP